MGEFIKDRLPDPETYFESEGLVLVGKGKWRTTECHFHGGSDSMRINIASGGWVCMACGIKGGDVLAHHIQAHGLDFIDAAKALGAWHDDCKPSLTQRPKPLSARAALQVLALEATLIVIAAGNIARGCQLTNNDHARVLLAGQRINIMNEAFQ